MEHGDEGRLSKPPRATDDVVPGDLNILDQFRLVTEKSPFKPPFKERVGPIPQKCLGASWGAGGDSGAEAVAGNCETKRMITLFDNPTVFKQIPSAPREEPGSRDSSANNSVGGRTGTKGGGRKSRDLEKKKECKNHEESSERPEKTEASTCRKAKRTMVSQKWLTVERQRGRDGSGAKRRRCQKAA